MVPMQRLACFVEIFMQSYALILKELVYTVALLLVDHWRRTYTHKSLYFVYLKYAYHI